MDILRRVLFLFLDGVGLRADDPAINPLARANLPHLEGLLGGRRLVIENAGCRAERADLCALNTTLGVPGMPQSATGQAVLLTGHNIPELIGYHYRPKPDPAVAQFLDNGNLFHRLRQRGCSTDFINAYPQRYFESIDTKHRLYSAIPRAATSAGLALHTTDDLRAGNALSADFTGQAWRDRLGFLDIPVFSYAEAGKQLAHLAGRHHFSFFEFWASDYAGHGQDMEEACALLEGFDAVLGGLLSNWDDATGIILITSDHGNLEDLSTHRHTFNPAPGLVIGAPALRAEFTKELHSLCDVAPAIEHFLT